MTAIATHIVNSRRLKKSTVYLACLLLTGTGGWSGYQRFHNLEHPEGTRFSRAQIRKRAIEIGLALNGSVRLISEPMLNSEHGSCGYSFFARRNMWVVLCESGNRQINLTIDDRTGRLACLMMDGSPGGPQGTQPQVTVKTERDAVVTAAEKLRLMQTLPQTAQIALRDKPVEEYKQNAWFVTWLVKNTAKSQPYTIKMALNSQTGLPIYLMSLEQKG